MSKFSVDAFRVGMGHYIETEGCDNVEIAFLY